jgi:hypothetical protein
MEHESARLSKMSARYDSDRWRGADGVCMACDGGCMEARAHLR